MTRQLRIELPGGIYHILSRGNNRQAVFQDDKDRELFCRVIEQASQKFSIEIHGYVLMDNHYHLLLKTHKTNLSQCMQWIGSIYTRRYNQRHKHVGHLFQGRYKSILVEDERYLLQLSCYIHRNPLRAGMVNRLADYKWSSYPAYALKKTKTPGWLTTDLILSRFSSKDPNRSYRLQVQNYSDEENRIWEDIKHGLLYGSERFVQQIRETLLKNKSAVELPQHDRIKTDIDVDSLIDQASQILKTDLLAWIPT